MSKRRLFSFIAAGLACAFLIGVSAPAQAGTVFVTSDSGGGTVDVNGSSTGASITNFNTVLTEINGLTLSPTDLPLSLTTLTIIDTGGVFSGSGTKTIGDSTTGTAVLTFAITSGSVTAHHFDLDGMITGVTTPGPVNLGSTAYDFSKLFPGGHISLGMSTTTGDFTTVVGGSGSILHAGFELDQSVPEPGSLALLGIGMTGFLAFRRFFKKTSVA